MLPRLVRKKTDEDDAPEKRQDLPFGESSRLRSFLCSCRSACRHVDVFDRALTLSNVTSWDATDKESISHNELGLIRNTTYIT